MFENISDAVHKKGQNKKLVGKAKMVKALAPNEGAYHLPGPDGTLYDTQPLLFLLLEKHKYNTETSCLNHIDAEPLNKAKLQAYILK